MSLLRRGIIVLAGIAGIAGCAATSGHVRSSGEPGAERLFDELHRSRRARVSSENIAGLQEKIFRENADWSAPTQTSIKAGAIFIGMSANQVETSWGRPFKVERAEKDGHVSEKWFYASQDKKCLFFEDGSLTNWSE